MDLPKLLADFAPGDDADADSQRRTLDLLQVPANICSRLTFDPGHLTASAFVLSPDLQAVLLIFHRKLQKWLQPGGHFETGDVDPLAAARRELLEECGVEASTLQDGIFDIDIHAIPSNAVEPAHLHFDLRFLLRASSWEVRLGDGIAEFRWLSLQHAVLQESSVAKTLAKIVTTKSPACLAL
jgi:8-oxo-dGTP pyrophosphatase MutT (NUDIX family)